MLTFNIIISIVMLIVVYSGYRIMWMQYMVTRAIDRGYKVEHFVHQNIIFWSFWIWDIRKFVTDDTFIERI